MPFLQPHPFRCVNGLLFTATDGYGFRRQCQSQPCRSDAVAEIGFGTTVFGASKVFTLSTFGAVSVSPLARFRLDAGHGRSRCRPA